MALKIRKQGNSRITTIKAPYDLEGGQALQISKLFGVTVRDALKDTPVDLILEGEFEFSKDPEEVISSGEIVYWDNDNHRVTREMRGNMGIGLAVVDAADPLDRIDVMLAPSTEDEAIEDLQQQVDKINTILPNARGVAYGSMDLETFEPGPDITGAWQDVDKFTRETIDAVGCWMDPETGYFGVTKDGAWRLDFMFNLTHNDINQGRTTYIRVWNVTDGVEQREPIPITIGRNQPGTSKMKHYAANLPESIVGKTLVYQIGGGETLSDIVWQDMSLTLEYLGAVDMDPDQAPEPSPGVAGYGSMHLSSWRSGDNFGGGWRDIDMYDAVSFTPVNCGFVELFGYFFLYTAGIWRADFEVGVTFNTDQGPSERHNPYRVLNKTAFIQKGPSVYTRVIPGAGSITRSMHFSFEVLEDELEDTFVIQHGGGSLFTGVVWYAHTLTLQYMGPSAV